MQAKQGCAFHSIQAPACPLPKERLIFYSLRKQCTCSVRVLQDYYQQITRWAAHYGAKIKPPSVRVSHLRRAFVDGLATLNQIPIPYASHVVVVNALNCSIVNDKAICPNCFWKCFSLLVLLLLNKFVYFIPAAAQCKQ